MLRSLLGVCAFLLCILLLILCFAGCGGIDPDLPAMNVEVRTNPDGSTTVVKNGNEQFFYQLGEDHAGVFTITARPETGKLFIRIFRNGDDNDLLYEGHEFPAQRFTVNATEAGEYTVRIRAENFTGEYSVDFKTTPRTGLRNIME